MRELLPVAGGRQKGTRECSELSFVERRGIERREQQIGAIVDSTSATTPHACLAVLMRDRDVPWRR